MPRLHGSRRLPQCVYTEGGRRCMRSATGDPPLCSAHRISAQEAARKAQTAAARMPQSPLSEVIEDFFAENPWAAQAGQILSDIGWNLGGVFGGGYSPPVDAAADQAARSRYVPPEQQAHRRYQQHAEQRQAPRPPPPPAVDPEIAAARRELGFGPRDPLTEEIVKDRKRELSRKWHPDLAGRDERKQKLHTQRIAAINNAADVLMAAIRDAADSE